MGVVGEDHMHDVARVAVGRGVIAENRGRGRVPGENVQRRPST